MSRGVGPRRGLKKRPDEVIVEVRRSIDPATVHRRPGWPEFDPKDIDSIMGSCRYVRVRGYGHFFEPSCNHHWRSPHSWCVIDLCNRELYTDIPNNIASVKPIASLISTMMLKKKWPSTPAKYFSEKERDLPMWVLPQPL